ncbi:hypothetical protein Pelo_3704 [Pelomyxa schiedti]|nr:hypothetical protein Pelo_3704 [Pelomyxa schiedti]
MSGELFVDVPPEADAFPLSVADVVALIRETEDHSISLRKEATAAASRSQSRSHFGPLARHELSAVAPPARIESASSPSARSREEQQSGFLAAWERDLWPQVEARHGARSWSDPKRAYLMMKAYETLAAAAEENRYGASGRPIVGPRGAIAHNGCGVDLMAPPNDEGESTESEIERRARALVGKTLSSREEAGALLSLAHSAMAEAISRTQPLEPSPRLMQRNDMVWKICSRRCHPIYEVLCTEVIDSFYAYLKDRVELYKISSGDKILRIVELGAGDGRFAHFISSKFSPSDQVCFQTCDTGADGIPPVFPIEKIHYREALKAIQPHIVIVVWMPIGEDWSSAIRSTDSVMEYILVGPKRTTGHAFETWSQVPLGWSMQVLPAISKFQICRCDTADLVGHSHTTSFRRATDVLPHAEHVVELRRTGAKLFHEGKLMEARETYTAMKIVSQKTPAFRDIDVVANINCAVVALKQGMLTDTVEYCQNALRCDCNHRKALFLCGKAHRLLGDTKLASEMLHRAYTLCLQENSSDSIDASAIQKELQSLPKF